MVLFFKLVLAREGITRKVTFERSPSWSQLADKIETLFRPYNLHADEVAVSYIDGDGDSVTISSNEELREYFAQERKLMNSGGTLRFFVQRVGAPSVPQVPSSVEGGITHGSPEMLGDHDWDRMDRDPLPESPLASIPLFGDDRGGIHPLLHNVFAYIPSDQPQSGVESPVISEARIEEVPSTRSQSTLSDAAPNQSRPTSDPPSYNNAANVNIDNNKGKAREIGEYPSDQPRARRAYGHSTSTTPTEKPPPDAPARNSFSHRDSAVPDPVNLTNANTPASPPPVSLYDDIANVMLQLSTIMTRYADGSYFRSRGVGGAVDAAVDSATSATRSAVEATARNVEASLENMLRNLVQQVPSRPPRATSGVPFGDAPRARPREGGAGDDARPWSMFTHEVAAEPDGRPPFAAPRGEKGPTPFVPPPFINPIEPMTDPPLRRLPGVFYGTPQGHMPGNGPAPRRPSTRDQPALHVYTTASGRQYPPPSGPPPGVYGADEEPFHESVERVEPHSAKHSTQSSAERERLETAKQLYKMEKANFRSQREAERREREERKALRSKGGPMYDRLAESLAAAFATDNNRSSATSVTDQPEDLTPIRPGAVRGFFNAPTHGQPAPPPVWDDPSPIEVYVPESWAPSSRHRGPSHEQNDRILRRLTDMGFPVSSHPDLPAIVKQETRNNLTKSDDQIVDIVLESLVGTVPTPPPQAGPSRPRRR